MITIKDIDSLGDFQFARRTAGICEDMVWNAALVALRALNYSPLDMVELFAEDDTPYDLEESVWGYVINEVLRTNLAL